MKPSLRKLSTRSILFFCILLALPIILLSEPTPSQDKTWQHLKRRVYPTLGIKMPTALGSPETDSIHVLLFRKRELAYGCDICQMSNTVSSTSYILLWDEDRDKFNMQTPLFHNAGQVTNGAALFGQVRKLDSIAPEAKPMALGRPAFLCVIVSVRGVVQCFYYDCPDEEQAERQITILVAFAYKVFADAAGFNPKTLEGVKRMLLGEP